MVKIRPNVVKASAYCLHSTSRPGDINIEQRTNTGEERDNGGKTINQLSGAKEPPPCIVQVQIKHIKNNITVGGTE